MKKKSTDLVELLRLNLVDALLLDLLVEEERPHLRQLLHPCLRDTATGQASKNDSKGT